MWIVPARPQRYFGLSDEWSPVARTFSPSDLPSLYVWLDSSYSTSITQSSNRVSAWASRAGAITYTQAIGANQPLYAASVYSGMPAIYFDGLTTAKYVAGSLNYTGIPGLTIYTVTLPVTLAGTDLYGITSGNSVRLLPGVANVTTSWSAGGGFTNRVNNSALSTSIPTRLCATYDLSLANVASEIYVNTATVTNGYTLGPNPVGTLGASVQQVGAHAGVSGGNQYIMEHIIFTVKHSATEMGLMDTYLRAKWGL